MIIGEIEFCSIFSDEKKKLLGCSFSAKLWSIFSLCNAAKKKKKTSFLTIIREVL